MNLEKLKVKMIVSFPFFGALLHNVDHVEDKTIPTACTNGNTIRYNPDFMDKMTIEEQLFIMAHELLHCAFLHVPRFEQLLGSGNTESAEVANWAADFLINDLLINEQKMVAPKAPVPPLINSKYKFSDWHMETLYKELMKNVNILKLSGSAGTGAGAGAGNDMVPDGGPPKSDAEKKENEKKWKIAVNEAATIAKKAGSCPASIERLITELLKNKVDWKDALANWFNQKIKENNDWHKPNRRFVTATSRLYLPSKRTEHIGRIAVAIDTSGSIREYELNIFGSELNYIFEQAKPTEVIVIYCDAAVNHTEVYKPEDFPLKLKAYGGGGTSFKPPFTWVKKHFNDEIAGLVYMTDMYGDFPSKAPEYPVLWMATSNIKAPFGDTVEYSIEKK